MQRKRPGRLLDTVSVCLFPVPSCNSFVCVCVVVVVEVVEGTRFALLLRSLVLSLFFSLFLLIGAGSVIPSYPLSLFLSFGGGTWRAPLSALSLLVCSASCCRVELCLLLPPFRFWGCRPALAVTVRACLWLVSACAPLCTATVRWVPRAPSRLPFPSPLLSCTWQWLTNPCVGVSLCVCVLSNVQGGGGRVWDGVGHARGGEASRYSLELPGPSQDVPPRVVPVSVDGRQLPGFCCRW